jgi:endonuclease/exonuclease/phosphatase family metal-dependent hydrolase
MRILSWNLNHRAARRRIPDWIVRAIVDQSPDVVVLTEYVMGPDHERFVMALRDAGFIGACTSDRPARQNQVFVAAREPLRRIDVPIWDCLSPAVPSNILHVQLQESGIDVVGFRMPAFSRAARPSKEKTWEWLTNVAAPLLGGRAVIAGDFNTAPEDADAFCGDRLRTFVDAGWRHARPASGFSWRHARSGRERQIDHLFHSPRLTAFRSDYSWAFHALDPEAAAGKVGRPDHAMLIVDLES